MIFEKRVEKIKKTLFEEYEITAKINVEDWLDEANEMALLISISDEDKITEVYNDYLVDKFIDDEYTDFETIARKIATKLI